MGYDPKDRAIVRGEIRVCYAMTGAIIGGIFLLLGCDTPDPSLFIDRALEARAARLAVDSDELP